VGNAEYWRSVPVYKGTKLQDNERSDASATDRSPVQTYAPLTRSVPSAPAYQDRAPGPAAAPRYEQRGLTGAPRSVPSAPSYERHAPERSASPPAQTPPPARVSPPSATPTPQRSPAPAAGRAPQQAAPAPSRAPSQAPPKR
jgi:hypothetical protein